MLMVPLTFLFVSILVGHSVGFRVCFVKQFQKKTLLQSTLTNYSNIPELSTVAKLLLEAKDAIIEAKDAIIEAKDEIIQSDTININEMRKRFKDNMNNANAKYLLKLIKENLSVLRGLIDEYEQPHDISSIMRKINLLNDTSKHVHHRPLDDGAVSIFTSGLSEDEIIVAKALCETSPVRYEVIDDSDEDWFEE